MKSVLEEELKSNPDRYIIYNWSLKVNNNEKPSASAHAQYIIARGLIAKYPETVDQQIARLKTAFNPNKHKYRNDYESLEVVIRDLSYSNYMHFPMSDDMKHAIRVRASEIRKKLLSW